MVNFSLRDFLMGFGDALALRGARSARWLARIGAWIAVFALPAFLVYALYSAARSWPDLFTSQWPISAISTGALWLMILALNATTFLGTISSRRGLPAARVFDSPYPATARALALALLAAARAGDEALAPPMSGAQGEVVASKAVVEPDEIMSLASPLLKTTAGPIFYRWLSGFGALIAAGSVALAGYFAATSVLPLTGPRSSLADWGMVIVAGVWGPIGALIGCALVAWANASQRFSTSIRWGISAAVDMEGVTARYYDARGVVIEEARVAWRDVQSLTQLGYHDFTMGYHTIYALDSARGVILWEATPNARYASAIVREQALTQREAAARLLRAARAGTGLPLRDITTTFATLREGRAGMDDGQLRGTSVKSAYSFALHEGDEDLARALWRLLHPPKEGHPQVEPSFQRMKKRDPFGHSIYTRHMTTAARKELLNTMRTLLPYLPANPDADPAVQDGRLDESDPARGVKFIRRTPFAWLALTAYLVWVCAFIFFPGPIARATAWYSAPLERALPAAVSAEPPIYVAPLTAAQPGWLVRAARADDPTSATFSASGYTLASGGQAIVSPAPHVTMADGAAQVTVNLAPGPGEQNAYNAAGLLLEAPSGAAGMVFEVRSDGSWRLAPAHRTGSAWSTDFEIAYGDSIGIATTAPNTLLVVRRGLTYLLYANGHFIEAVHDDTARIAPGGSVALMLDDSEGAARFSNIAVYPVPAGLPLWAQ